jgi:rubrerythrin
LYDFKTYAHEKETAMSLDLQEAVKRSIQTEKNAMNFYQLGALRMKNVDARRTFEILAREEREHAGQFFRIYTGTDIPSLDAFMDTPPDNESSWMASITRLVDGDFSEQKALELAMEREKNLEEALLETAGKVSDANVKAVFELNAKETHNHYLMIESEYARIMGMVHESDMDTYVRE